MIIIKVLEIIICVNCGKTHNLLTQIKERKELTRTAVQEEEFFSIISLIHSH